MVKFMLIAAIIVVPIGAKERNAYMKFCVSCHAHNQVSLQKTFKKALLVYGGEANMKAGLLFYMKNPSENSSVMDVSFLRRVGIKKPILISDDELKKALDIYWQKYTLIGKLR